MTMDREAVARIIDPGEWAGRDSYVMIMEDMVQKGQCARQTVDDIAAARVTRSLAKADQILSLLSPEGGGAAAAWQPIESAPRDGTPILACSVNHDAREVVCWQDGLESGSFENLIVDEPEPEKGWVNNGPIKDRFYANPRWFTHWQPLPTPPADAKVRG